MTLKLQMLASLDAKGVTAGANTARREIKGIETATKSASNAARAQGAATTKAGMASVKSTALARHEMTNLSFQMNDIAQGLATGQQSPFTIMIQQGAQVSQIMGQRGLGQIIPAIGASFLSLLSPTTFFFAAITAGGYAASAVFSALQGDVVDVEALLKEHGDTISSLEKLWARSADGAFRYTKAAREVALFLARQKQDELAKELQQKIGQEVQEGFTSAGKISRGFDRTEEFRTIAEGYKLIRNEARAGVADIDAYQLALKKIIETSKSKDMRQYAQSILDATKKSAEMALELKNGENAIKDMGGTARQAARDLDKFERSLSRLANGNREITDRAKALRDWAAAMKASRNEADEAKANTALNKRIARIEAVEGGRGMPTPTRRPNDFEREKPLKKARTGLSREERAAKRKQDHATRWLRTKGEQIALQQLELTLIGRTDAARQKAKAMLAAEQEIHRRRIDLHGEEARAIRNSARALADVTSELARQKKAWGEVQSTGTSAIDDILGAVTSNDWEGALKSISTDLSKTILSLGAGNPLKNQLYGTNLPTLDDTGGISGFFKSLLGGGPAGASTGQMSVTAASVIVNGGGIKDTIETFGKGLSRSTDALANGGDSLAGTAQNFSSEANSLADGFSSGLSRILSGINNSSGSGSGVLGSITKAFFGGISNGSGSFGSGLNIASASAAASPGLTALIASGVGGTFDKGGATPSGADSDVAGVVHANEFVFDAPATRKIGVGNLEALRSGKMKGFREGGFTGSSYYPPSPSASPEPPPYYYPPSNPSGSSPEPPPILNVTIINNSSTEIASFEEDEPDAETGGRHATMVLENMVADGINSHGSPINRALGRRPPVKVR